MKKTWKPIVAGVLDIVAVAPVFLFWVLLLLVWLFTGEVPPETRLGFAFYWPVFIAIGLAGAVFSFRRRMWWIALASPLVLIPGGTFWNSESGVRVFFGLSPQLLEAFFIIPTLTAAVLIVLSKEEFR